MRTIKIKSLQLEGYRGQNVKIDFTNETEIYARNGIGKSTVFDAFCQLLTRADSKNRTNCEMFDNRTEPTQENSLPISIVGIFEIDGYDTELKQTTQISWVRNKSKEYYERGTGNKYYLSIDGIERTSTEWNNWINENLCPIEKLKCISNPSHFMGIPKWEEQRKMLTDISGEISRTDFNGDFSDLFEKMDRYTIDELKAQIKGKIKPLEVNVGTPKGKGKLHIEIETLEGMLPDLSEVDTAQQRIDDNQKKLDTIDADLLGANTKLQPLIDERNKQLDVIDNKKRKVSQRANEFEDEQKAESKKLKLKIENTKISNEELPERNAEIQSLFENDESKLLTQQTLLKRYNEQITILRADKDELKAKVFTADNCASCGQELPYDKIEELRAKFNTNKDTKLSAIILEGKALVEKKKAINEEIERLKALIDAGVQLEQLQDVSDLEKQLAEAEKSELKFADTDECKKLAKEIIDLEAKLTVIPQTDNTETIAQKTALIKAIKEDSQTVKLKEIHSETSDKIAKKKKDLRDSANELAKCEKEASDIKKYEREHADIVSRRTNELFQRVQVVMMKQNKSGEWDDCCELTYNNVPSKTWNFAERIVSAIDISNVFGKFYELNMPLFIDNCESINEDNLPITDRQTIKLIVSEDDNELRIVNR